MLSQFDQTFQFAHDKFFSCFAWPPIKSPETKATLLFAVDNQSNGKGCETKPPILEWDKTADFENETKSPILKTGQNRRF